MHTCSLLRTSFWPHSARIGEHAPSAVSRNTRTALAIVLGIAELAGWHRLQQLLIAIPDSNDDFGLF